MESLELLELALVVLKELPLVVQRRLELELLGRPKIRYDLSIFNR
jgi:hypothetical protein